MTPLNPEPPASPATSGTAAGAVELANLVTLIDGFPALAGVDLTVAVGEIVQLRGSNGAGKTTLLRVCAGLVAARSGSARVLGFDLLADRRRVRPYVGLLGHTTTGYADLTVADQLRFSARLCGSDQDEMRAAADRLGVEPRLGGVRIERLSAGQRRRVALACLAAQRPALWLLDEPYSALDADGRRRLNRLLTDAAAAGATVLFSSHDHTAGPAEGRSEGPAEGPAGVATRIVTLEGGVVATVAPAGAP